MPHMIYKRDNGKEVCVYLVKPKRFSRACIRVVNELVRWEPCENMEVVGSRTVEE